jgi:hypothetical protein
MNVDSANHWFVDVGNVRVTYVPAGDRRENAHRRECDAIRMQSYKGHGRALNQGAEMPLTPENDLLELIESLCRLHRQGSAAMLSQAEEQ